MLGNCIFETLKPPSAVAFVGLGQMGLPMAARLVRSGFEVHGVDLSVDALTKFAELGGKSYPSLAEALHSNDCKVIITMLPNGSVVQAVLLEGDGANIRRNAGMLVVEMSSSAPADTRRLAEMLDSFGIAVIDAPVSGGVRKAIDGTLAIMAGGKKKDIARADYLLKQMSVGVFHTGSIGSAHAMKALNNYVSAAGFAAASEALYIGKQFGLEPETVIDVLNSSTGRNNSTETKIKQFVISESFGSGFSLALMAKDLQTAADLSNDLGLKTPALKTMADLWAQASEVLDITADHTEFYRFVEGQMSE